MHTDSNLGWNALEEELHLNWTYLYFVLITEAKMVKRGECSWMWCHVRAETACFSSVAKTICEPLWGEPLVFIQQHYHHKAMWPVLCYCSHTLRPEGRLITTIEDINFMVKCLLASTGGMFPKVSERRHSWRFSEGIWPFSQFEKWNKKNYECRFSNALCFHKSTYCRKQKIEMKYIRWTMTDACACI